MKLSIQKRYIVDIEDCPRCGEDHEHVLFQPLNEAQTRDDLWAFCGETSQPILISSEEVGYE